MAACSIFDEDEVCIPTSSGGFKYGLVVESSEYISSDEDDDEDDESRVQRGQLKVAWHPSGDETVVSEKRVILTDRSLMPGDVIRRLISGEESQRGYVQSCNIKCHAKILGTEQYIYNIDAKDIRPIQEFDPEPEVTLDTWVGHVMEVNEEITVRFPCGARCRLSNAGVLNLEDVHDKRQHHSEFVMRNFYPGQELSGMHEDYEDATWIRTSNVRGPKCKAKSLFSATVVVEEVKTNNVDVNWVCKGFTHTGAGTDKLKSPPNTVEADDLKRLRRLDCFEHCHMQIGDKGYYVVKESDTLLHKISPRKHVTPDIIELYGKENVIVIGTSADGIHVKQRGLEKRTDENEMNAKNIANGKEADDGLDGTKENSDTNKANNNKENTNDEKGTVADDEFEDLEDDGSDSGSESDSVKSGPDSPVLRKKNRKRSSVLGHGFKRVRGKKAKKKAHRIERDVKPGDRVPIEIWYTFSTCTVMWQDGKVEDNIPSPQLFPIHHLDELEFFPGDFVLDSKGNTSTDYGVVVTSDHKERTVMVKWVQPYTPGQLNKPEEKEPVELSVFDIKDHQDYKFRCGHTVIRVGGYEGDTQLEAVGQVYRIDPEGTIQIWWPNNTITKCYPQELYLIGEEFQSESGSESEWTDDEEEEEEEEEESDVSWETENEETATDTDTDGKKNKAKQLWTVSDSKKKELDALLDRAQVAVSGLLNIFVNVAGPFFKNSRQVFHDILAIFKRCKEVEKILKSSFFEDDEIADLISDIKSELRKEKTAKLARHIAQVFKYRNTTVDNEKPQSKDADESDNQSEKNTESEKKQESSSQVEGAVGGKMELKEESETQNLKKALIEYGSNIDDPIMQIIFDTSLHATIAESAQKNLLNVKKQQSEDNSSGTIDAKGDSVNDTDNIGDLVNKKSVSDIIQSVIDSVCDNRDQELKAAFQAVKQNVQLASDGEDKMVEACQAGNQPIREQTGLEESSQNFPQAGTQSTETGPQDDKLEEAVLPPNHRSLCIRVCKALNVRLLHVKQEVNRKWLAYKFGCNENVSDIELFEKMQAKMIESVESGEGPLQLESETNDGSAATGTECIKELESLEERRVSPENGVEEQGIEKDEAVEHVINGDIEEKGFELCSETPFSHHFKYQEQKPSNQKSFSSAVRKEWMLLRTSLPDGIFVKVFEDRMNIHSVPDEVDTLYQKSESAEIIRQLTAAKKTMGEIKKAKEDNITELKKDKKKATDSIQQFRKKMEVVLEKLEKESIKEVEAEYGRIEAKLQNAIKEAENVAADLEQYANKLKMSGGNKAQEFVCVKASKKSIKKVKEGEKELKEPEVVELDFLIDSQIQTFLQQLKAFGQVTIKETTYKPRSAVYAVKKQTAVCVKQSSDADNCYIIGSCFTEDGSLLLADNNNKKLKLVDHSTECVKHHLVLEAHPRAVCLTSKHEAAVSLNNSTIQFVSLKDKLSASRKLMLGHECYCLAYKDDKLFISDRNQAVYIHDTTGTLLHKITTDSSGNPIFSASCHVSLSTNGDRVYVADGNKGLITLDIQGHYESTFTDPDVAWPAGVCVDGRGNIFVSGWGSSSIVQISEKSKTKLGVLGNVTNSLSVCFDPRQNRLVVTSHLNNSVAVCELA